MLFFARWKIWTINLVCLAGLLLSVPAFVSRQQLDLPDWFPWRGVSLGLDLRGGAYLLVEVDMRAVLADRLRGLQDQVQTKLRGQVQAFGFVARDNALTFRVRDPAQTADAVRLARELAQPVGGGLVGGGVPDLAVASLPDGTVTMTLSEAAVRDRATAVIAQSIEIVRRRIDPEGVLEPTIVRQGANRILVQVAGASDADVQRIKERLGKTAKMTFHLLDESVQCGGGVPPPGVMCLPGEGREAATLLPIRQRVSVEGANLTDAKATTNSQTGEWVVSFTFDGKGTRDFAEISRANVGRRFAIVLDNKVISAPVIREAITGGRGQISGSFTAASASELAVLLRAGALPAPLSIVEERTVGPDLGADAIRAGIASILAGAVLVIVFIVWSYGLFGVFACVGLVANLALTLAVLNLLEATLTLPGMAGVLLTLGLSVDANILINERIREEQRLGKTPFAAMEAGFQRAFSTIFDSNVTTLIKMLLLYVFGSGPVRGFAVTITFGILTSFFTSTVVVRLLMVTWLRARKRVALPV
jgi:preprotein translocase subunit SecD